MGWVGSRTRRRRMRRRTLDGRPPPNQDSLRRSCAPPLTSETAASAAAIVKPQMRAGLKGGRGCWRTPPPPSRNPRVSVACSEEQRKAVPYITKHHRYIGIRIQWEGAGHTLKGRDLRQKSVNAIAQVMLPACTQNLSTDEWD